MPKHHGCATSWKPCCWPLHVRAKGQHHFGETSVTRHQCACACSELSPTRSPSFPVRRSPSGHLSPLLHGHPVHLMATVAAVVGARRAIMQRERARAREREQAREGQQARLRVYYGATSFTEQEHMSAAERERAKQAQALYDLLVSFPTHTHASSEDVIGSEITECAICLAAFAAGDRLKRLSCSGSHCFHSRCLRQWFEASLHSNGKTQCPVCRHECGAGETPPPSAQLYAA
jgi:hypothetical protein